MESNRKVFLHLCNNNIIILSNCQQKKQFKIKLKSREKEGGTGLYLLSAFFISLKNLLAGKGGK